MSFCSLKFNQQPKDMIDLSSTTILVTGGAQGIGRAIVTLLLARKAKVVIADCDLKRVKSWPQRSISRNSCSFIRPM